MITLDEGATRVVSLCAGVQAGEHVVVLAALDLAPEVPEALARAGRAAGATVATHFVELEPALAGTVADEVLAADVVIAMTRLSIAHAEIGRLAMAAGTRVIAMTKADAETLTRGAIEADFLQIESACTKLAKRMSVGTRISVTTRAGTLIEASIDGREGYAGTSRATTPGSFTGTPDIEAYIAPVEESVNGRMVIDASSTYFGLVDEPITIEIREGRAVSFEGGRHAARLRSHLLDSGWESSFVFAEIGLGLNPMARMVGNIIEDEAVYGSGHFALGTNETFGGANKAPVHCDLVYWHPTVVIDDEIVMRDGTLGEEYRW